MNFIKLFIVSMYLFSSISVYAQSDKLNDTIIALGKLNYDHFGGDMFNYYNCSLRSAEYIKKNEIVVITGVKNCIAKKK